MRIKQVYYRQIVSIFLVIGCFFTINCSLTAEEVVRCAFDFGSGTIKMQVSVVETEGNHIVGDPLLAKYATLGLSEDIEKHDGWISSAFIQKAEGILSQYKMEALKKANFKGYSTVQFSGIATAAFRKADNGEAVIDHFQDELNIPFQIISQNLEGELGFLTAKALFPEFLEETLIAWDSGNGSFQMSTHENIYQGSFGHGNVRTLLSKEIRKGAALETHESGNPISWDEAFKLKQAIKTLLPLTPHWLTEKLNSADTAIVTFGDGESIFALTAQAIGYLNEQKEQIDNAVITLQDVENVIYMHMAQEDEVFDAQNLHRKTLTSALHVLTIMQHFHIQKIHYKRSIGNTPGMLIASQLWQERLCMQTASYLYKFVTPTQWEESLLQDCVVNSALDQDFIHLATEEQLPDVAEKFWKDEDYVILKIAPNKLVGRLIFETNPGGSKKYFHLYDGSIPLDAVEEVKFKLHKG